MSQQDLNALFGGANAAGTLSTASAQTLTMTDIGPAIMAGMGVNVGDVTASEVILLALLVDDSGSIRSVKGNPDAMIDGINGIHRALFDTKQSGQILAYMAMLNRGLIYPFRHLKDPTTKTIGIPLLDSTNYDPYGGTPLYPRTKEMLGTVVAKVQSFADNGVPTRAVSIIITDGGDTSGGRPEELAPIVTDLLRSETHLVIGMGIKDGYTDFKDVFTRMGLQDKWILEVGATPSEIRRACDMVSQSAVRASQAPGAQFSKVVAGGFGASP